MYIVSKPFEEKKKILLEKFGNKWKIY
jgi:hypothetical protein